MARIKTIKIEKQNGVQTTYGIQAELGDRLFIPRNIFGFEFDGTEDYKSGDFKSNGDIMSRDMTYNRLNVIESYVNVLLNQSSPAASTKAINKSSVIETPAEPRITASGSPSGTGTIYPNPHYKYNLVYNVTTSGGAPVCNVTLTTSGLDSTMYNGQEIYLIIKNLSSEKMTIKLTKGSQEIRILGFGDGDVLSIDGNTEKEVSILKLNGTYYIQSDSINTSTT